MPSTTSKRRRVALGVAAVATSLIAMSSATAGASVSPRDGSGTSTDPWVPMRNAHTTCQSTGLYGNYSGGHHQDKITDLPAGTYIGVRYITSDGNSADVFWHGGGTWGFMLTSCFAFS